MAAKLLFILVVAVFSFALAAPSGELNKAETKESMKTAETFHFGIGIGHPGYGWGGYRGGYGPYYGPYDYSGFLPHFMNYHY